MRNQQILRSFALAACASCGVLAAAVPRGSLSSGTLALVKQRLAENDNDSWVAGTETEALLELDYPSLSVFNTSYASNSRTPSSTNSIIAEWYAKRPAGAQQMAVVEGGAAADPASLGTAWILAEETTDNDAYAGVVTDQIGYLLNTVPHLPDGTMSMRPPSEAVQLWADFMYMVPPFLAYYGATSGDFSAVLEAYNQCKLYRTALQDPTTSLWKHIILGSWNDVGLWATGNAWAAAGMTRVIATMQNNPALARRTQAREMMGWTNEIITASWSRADTSGLLPNYFETGSFRDSSATALMAAATFRLATLGYNVTSSNIAAATRARSAVNGKVDTTTGWLRDVVDPLNFKDKIDRSPEGNAFILLLEAAYRDYSAI